MAMKQQILAMAADQGAGFDAHRKPARRNTFLGTMHRITPWAALCAVVEPHYGTPGEISGSAAWAKLLTVRIGNHQVSIGRIIWNNSQPPVRTTLNLRVIATWVSAVITVIYARCNINWRVLLSVQRRSVVDWWPKKRTADDDDSGMPMKMVEPAKLMGVYKPIMVMFKPSVVFKPMMLKSLALASTPMAMHAT
jgi:hypothetical protein